MAAHPLLQIERPILQDLRLPMSFEEFVELPEKWHAEWVDGEAIIFVTTTEVHARYAFFLARVIAGFADEFDLGEVFTAPYGMRVRDGRSFREPDVMFIRTEQREHVVGIAMQGP